MDAGNKTMVLRKRSVGRVRLRLWAMNVLLAIQCDHLPATPVEFIIWCLLTLCRKPSSCGRIMKTIKGCSFQMSFFSLVVTLRKRLCQTKKSHWGLLFFINLKVAADFPAWILHEGGKKPPQAHLLLVPSLGAQTVLMFRGSVYSCCSKFWSVLFHNLSVESGALWTRISVGICLAVIETDGEADPDWGLGAGGGWWIQVRCSWMRIRSLRRKVHPSSFFFMLSLCVQTSHQSKSPAYRRNTSKSALPSRTNMHDRQAISLYEYWV